MYVLVTNLWGSDLHLNSIFLQPISVAKLRFSSKKHQIHSPAGSASANQSIISAFELSPQVGLKSRVPNEAKNEAKTRPEKGLPPWTWRETYQWVTKTLCLPAPSWVHMHPRKPGADVVSACLHWHKPTVGQMTTYQENLSNKFLTHRRTEASIAQDEFGPPKSKPPQPSPYGQATWLKQDVPRYKTFSCRGRQRTQGWWHKLYRNGNPGSCPCCNHRA